MKMSKSSQVIMLVVLCGCGGSKNPGPVPDASSPTDACSAGAVESDAADAGPLAGPGIDPATGKLAEPQTGSYIVATTWGILRDSPEVLMRAMQLIGSVAPVLVTSPGLVAYQFRRSASCRSGRTLTVWSDLPSMYAFVGSSAHRAAMSEVMVTNERFATTHFTVATAGEVTWQNAAAHLAQTER
jgi:hypothetical protein